MAVDTPYLAYRYSVFLYLREGLNKNKQTKMQRPHLDPPPSHPPTSFVTNLSDNFFIHNSPNSYTIKNINNAGTDLFGMIYIYHVMNMVSLVSKAGLWHSINSPNKLVLNSE